MKTVDAATIETGAGLEPDSSIAALVFDVWRDLLASGRRQNLFVSQLSRALGAWWYVSWHDGRLLVQRRQAAATVSAPSVSKSGRSTLGLPGIICDGQLVSADMEPVDDSLRDELAFVMAKIAKYLNWTRMVIHGSAFFQKRLRHHALHERDVYSWALETARLLRDQRPAQIDWDGVAEELEDLGISQERALASHLRVLLAHLLKWSYQSGLRSKSWRLNIENSRDEVNELLERSPGLRPKIPSLLEVSYRRARRDAAGDTSLEESDFPTNCPWSYSQIIKENFWPDSRTSAEN